MITLREPVVAQLSDMVVNWDVEASAVAVELRRFTAAEIRYPDSMDYVSTFCGHDMPEKVGRAAGRISYGVPRGDDLQAFKAWLVDTAMLTRDPDLLPTGKGWARAKGYDL